MVTAGEGGVGNHRKWPMSTTPRRGENAVARVLFLEGRKGHHTCPARRICGVGRILERGHSSRCPLHFWVKTRGRSSLGAPHYSVNKWKPSFDFHSTPILLLKLPFHSQMEVEWIGSGVEVKIKFWKSNGGFGSCMEVEWKSFES